MVKLFGSDGEVIGNDPKRQEIIDVMAGIAALTANLDMQGKMIGASVKMAVRMQERLAKLAKNYGPKPTREEVVEAVKRQSGGTVK